MCFFAMLREAGCRYRGGGGTTLYAATTCNIHTRAHTHAAVSPNTLTHLQFYVRLSSLDFIEVATTNAICAPPPPPARHFLWLISVIACGLHRLVKIFLLAHGRSVCSPILSALLSMLYYLQHSLNVASTSRIRNVRSSITWP